MASYHYDFEGLYFQVFRKVLRINETLGEDALDKSQLREVATSIFIAKTQKGVVKPGYVNGFLEAVLKKIEHVKDRQTQEAIYKAVLNVVDNNHKQTKKEEIQW